MTLSAAANGTLSNLAGGSYNSTTGVYSLSNVTLLAAQAALRGLVFTPADHQVAPNQSDVTTFTIALSDGISTGSDNSTTVAAIATDTPVTIGGTTASTQITDEQTATPFSTVTLSDPDTGVTYSASVTLRAAANGTLSNLAGGSYNSTSGVYSLTSVTLSAAQAALRGLIFTPTDHQAAPSQAVDTTLTIALGDGISISSDNSTTVAAIAVDTPVAIGGTTTTDTTDQQACTPFSGVTLSDPDTGVTYSVKATLSAAANGTLSNLGGGSYDAATGVYSLTSVTLSAVQAALSGLVFTPADHQVPPNQRVTTTITITVTDGFSSSTDSSTIITVTAADAPVTIAGTATTHITAGQTAAPFSAVNLTDPDMGSAYSLAVSLSAAANGTLSNLCGGSYDSTTGVFTLNNVTLLAAQAALRDLVFTPAGTQGAGSSVSTTFTITVSDGISSAGNNSANIVVNSSTGNVAQLPNIGPASVASVFLPGSPIGPMPVPATPTLRRPAPRGKINR